MQTSGTTAQDFTSPVTYVVTAADNSTQEYVVTATVIDHPFCLSITDISLSECEGLLALYDSTDGPNWTNKTGWGTSTTVCNNAWN